MGRTPRGRASRAGGRPVLLRAAVALGVFRRRPRHSAEVEPRVAGQRPKEVLAMRAVVERSLAPELSVVDVEADLLWHRDGRVSLVYQLDALHEPGLSDEEFERVARQGEDVWSGLPEATEYQFLVLVDARRGLRLVEEALHPIAETDERAKLLEELRQGRVAALNGHPSEATGFRFQERRHFLTASFWPSFRGTSALAALRARVREWLSRRGNNIDKYEQAYERVVQESATFERRVEVALGQLGLGFTRCRDEALERLLYELLNPTSSLWREQARIPGRSRLEAAALDDALV